MAVENELNAQNMQSHENVDTYVADVSLLLSSYMKERSEIYQMAKKKMLYLDTVEEI